MVTLCVRLGARIWWIPLQDVCDWSCEEILKIVLSKFIQVSLFGWNQVLRSYVSQCLSYGLYFHVYDQVTSSTPRQCLSEHQVKWAHQDTNL